MWCLYWLNHPSWHRYTTFVARPVRLSVAYIFGRILAMEKCIRDLCKGVNVQSCFVLTDDLLVDHLGDQPERHPRIQSDLSGRDRLTKQDFHSSLYGNCPRTGAVSGPDVKMDKSTSNPLFDVVDGSASDVHLEIRDSPGDWYFPDKNDLNA